MRNRRIATGILSVALAAGLLGCGIPEEQHNAVLKDLENTKMELAEAQRAGDQQEEELRAEIAGLTQRITELEGAQASLQGKLDEANAELSMYESKTGGLEEALETTKGELDELRKQRLQAEKRLRQYREVAEKLANMVESGKLSVKIRNGKMVIELSNNILFASGQTRIKEGGQEALAELAQVLQTIDNRAFLVTGHTDNVPISNSRFQSNWELSTARAVEVVQFLQEAGVAPKNLAAAGYGEFDPVADNSTDEGKALNRRIEIVMMPNLEELPSIPKDVLGSKS